MTKPKVVVVGGPTGVGKSDFAFEMSRLLDGELISCDSVQVYRGLNIGANKTPVEADGREHLLDLVDWSEDFTAADFYENCMKAIELVLKKDKLPILVGGTGFYLDWILNGRPKAPPTCSETLKIVEEELKSDVTWEESYSRLKQVDPEYAQVILPNDYYRLKRALSVYKATGQPLSSFKRSDSGRIYDFRCFYLTSDREYVCRNIDGRCEKMLEGGLIDEVVGLMRVGLDTNCSAGRSIGYLETINFIRNLQNVDLTDEKLKRKVFLEYLAEFKSATRQYSRKQEGWFSKRSEFRWIFRPHPFVPISADSEIVKVAVDAVKADTESWNDADSAINVASKLARELSLRATGDVVKSKKKKMREYKSLPGRYETDSETTAALLDHVYQLLKE